VSASSWPARYEIRVADVLDDRWAAWFDGLQVSGQGEETVICGLVADQSALHGLLTKVRDLGLCLLSVRWLPICRPAGIPSPITCITPNQTRTPPTPHPSRQRHYAAGQSRGADAMA